MIPWPCCSLFLLCLMSPCMIFNTSIHVIQGRSIHVRFTMFIFPPNMIVKTEVMAIHNWPDPNHNGGLIKFTCLWSFWLYEIWRKGKACRKICIDSGWLQTQKFVHRLTSSSGILIIYRFEKKTISFDLFLMRRWSLIFSFTFVWFLLCSNFMSLEQRSNSVSCW